MTNINKSDLYQQVTNTIIELLVNHMSLNNSQPWVNVEGGNAHNAHSKTVYSGINQLLLSYHQSKHKYPSNAWLTFLQVQQSGGKVKQGKKSQIVVFADFLYFNAKGQKVKYEDVKAMPLAERSALKKVHYLKHYNVFNVADVDNLPADYYAVPEIKNFTEFEKDETAETLINSTGAKINYVIGNRAFYSPSNDEITLPIRAQFTGAVPFYNTAFHELAHWTGHPDRLNREKGAKFGSEQYAKEELIAELSAAFICSALGFNMSITDNAAYLKNWLTALQNDKRFIVIASAQASKASDFIFSLQKQAAAAA